MGSGVRSVRGLLLAAGAGRRMGRPKALVDDWLVRSLEVLREGGCDGVTVVLGAAAEEARALLDDPNTHSDTDLEVVVALDWAEGMGASLRAGLATLDRDPGDGCGDDAGVVPEADAPGAGVDAALVTLVDLPDVGSDVVRRVLAAGADEATLRRAAYDGVPGHPVLIGRAHWAGVRASARGDRGARAYLASHDVELVECGDLASGVDRDEPTSGQRHAE